MTAAHIGPLHILWEGLCELYHAVVCALVQLFTSRNEVDFAEHQVAPKYASTDEVTSAVIDETVVDPFMEALKAAMEELETSEGTELKSRGKKRDKRRSTHSGSYASDECGPFHKPTRRGSRGGKRFK
jgi:hypothetical protein